MIEEFDDAVARAHRLSKAREAVITNTEIPSSIIKNEDLMIYTRWLICHFHSIKKMQRFQQV